MTKDLNTFLEDTIKMCVKDLVVYIIFYHYILSYYFNNKLKFKFVRTLVATNGLNCNTYIFYKYYKYL